MSIFFPCLRFIAASKMTGVISIDAKLPQNRRIVRVDDRNGIRSNRARAARVDTILPIARDVVTVNGPETLIAPPAERRTRHHKLYERRARLAPAGTLAEEQPTMQSQSRDRARYSR
jgi:hypothetical protein